MCEKHRFFFEFDKAFTHQLIEKFEASPAHRLAEDVAPLGKGWSAPFSFLTHPRRRP
jgi:hypothetical protein